MEEKILRIVAEVLSIYEKKGRIHLLVAVSQKSGNKPYWPEFPPKIEFPLNLEIELAEKPDDWEFRSAIEDHTGLVDGFLNKCGNSVSDLVGRVVSLDVKIRLDHSRRVPLCGFRFFGITSLDLAQDVDEFLNKIGTQNHACSSKLPVVAFLSHLNYSIEDLNGGVNRFRYQDLDYEIATPERVFSTPVSSYIIQQNFCFDRCSPSGSLVSLVRENHSETLNLHNIYLIFDKFYRPVRGLGHNWEYKYGQMICYFISKDGNIVHHYHEDKVNSRWSDNSPINNKRGNTKVLRLGDALTQEMIDFLSDPIAGHRKANILFKGGYRESYFDD